MSKRAQDEKAAIRAARQSLGPTVERAEAKAQPLPKPDKGPSPFARFMAERAAKKPDWSEQGFIDACDWALAEASKKEWLIIEKLLEWLAYQVGKKLRQRHVTCEWIAFDKDTQRPYLLITLGDRWRYYHDVAVSIPLST